MKILVGTMNPGKLDGVREAFACFFGDVEVIGCNVSSDVSDQPVNEETLEGARNRANNATKYGVDNNILSDYYVGIEEGIMELYGSWFDITFAVVKDNNGNESIGFGPGLLIPSRYIPEIKSSSFGSLMNRLLDKENLNIGLGGIYTLTNSTISRIDTTKDAVIMTITKFYNKSWSYEKTIKMELSKN